jgi:hypothetical protein
MSINYPIREENLNHACGSKRSNLIFLLTKMKKFDPWNGRKWRSGKVIKVIILSSDNFVCVVLITWIHTLFESVSLCGSFHKCIRNKLERDTRRWRLKWPVLNTIYAHCSKVFKLWPSLMGEMTWKLTTAKVMKTKFYCWFISLICRKCLFHSV